MFFCVRHQVVPRADSLVSVAQLGLFSTMNTSLMPDLEKSFFSAKGFLLIWQQSSECSYTQLSEVLCFSGFPAVLLALRPLFVFVMFFWAVEKTSSKWNDYSPSGLLLSVTSFSLYVGLVTFKKKIIFHIFQYDNLKSKRQKKIMVQSWFILYKVM